jgi:phenylalanyl-tRNA synthetase beta chain
VIENVDPRMPTPLWMSERLRRCGIRPVSLLVDVTQYVMLELGQPMHAYDLARLAGPIRVRRARSGERVKLLDGHEYTLDEDFLVIADAHELHGLAGIMGGFASRVTEATRAVFLEAAHFAPEAIQGRARRLGLHTEAAHRFERGVDPQAPRRALERATQLLLELAGGIAGPVCETVCEEFLPQRLPVSLRRARLRRVLGIDVPDHEVERILAALEMWIERTPEGWRVTPPSRRFDVAIEEDLIEEVARIHGYDAVPCHPPRGELRLPPLPEAGVPLARLRAHLAARGYQEAICYSFVAADLLGRWSLDAGAVPLANPLSADLAVMRTSLLPGLVEALKRNHNRQQERVRLFETGLVFIGSDGLQQVPRLAAVASGRAAPESWATDKRLVDFFDLKADVESLLALGGDRRQVEFTPSREPWLHPGRSARISIDGEPVGVLGELHPRLQKILDLNVAVQVFELALAAVTAGRVPQARLPSRFPAVRRDLALVVADDLPYAAIERSVRAVLGNCLAELRVFDEYHDPNLGVGTKSLAIGLILQDDSRTLTDQDADRCVAQAIEALERECHAKLRGKQ